MPLRLIEICAPDGRKHDIKEIADKHNTIDVWHGVRNTDHRRPLRILVALPDLQKMMDALQAAMGKKENWRMNIFYVEATVPKPEEKEKEKQPGKEVVKGSLTREELYTQLEKSASLDSDFILFVVLSTIVCAIGLIQDSIAAVIGAMVIAPLLGPNLTLAFGIALGDRRLISKAALTNLSGVALTFALAFAAGAILPLSIDSNELLLRTNVNFESLALALASGAAAALSLTSGISATLVGVMVAVALMPPAVTFGVMAGAGQYTLSYGAGLLLAANIVSVSIAAQAVFLLKGFKPRTWYMREKSRQSVKLSLAFWLLMLVIVAVLIYLHNGK